MSAHDTCLWYQDKTDRKVYRSCVGKLWVEPISLVWCPDCGRVINTVDIAPEPDQAEGLRELVAGQKGLDVYVIGGRIKIDGVEIGYGQGDTLETIAEKVRRAKEIESSISHPVTTHDEAALWRQLKSELEAEAEAHYQDSANKWHGDAIKAAAARAILDRMLQMETLASARRIVVPSTMEPT